MAYSFIIITIHFCLLFIQLNAKVIQYELYHQHSIIPFIKLKIGSPTVEMAFRMSTKHSVLYVVGNRVYDSNESKSYKSKRNTPSHPLIGISKNSYRIGLESVSFSDVVIPSMPFVLVEEEIEIDNTLGIGYLQPKDHWVSEYSFLHQLKLNKYIDTEMISIKSHADTFLLEIGDYPLEAKRVLYTSKENKYKRCRLIATTPQGDNNPLFQCWVDSLFFNDNTLLPIKSKVTWLITRKTIEVPMKIFDFIINKFFSAALETKECSLQGLSHQMLSCQKTYYNHNLETLGLIIGKWSIKLLYSELFNPVITNERMLFIFEGSTYQSIKDSIEIGVNIFKRHISIFDVEKGEFGLIEKKN